MLENLSNQLKGAFFFGDITEGVIVRQHDCFTIQKFNYKCSRKRNSYGIPYGVSNIGTLDIVVKSLPDNKTKEFYRQLAQEDMFSYTFLFNAKYDKDKILEDYYDAMVVNGYIVQVSESFGEVDNTSQNVRGMEMCVKILVNSITYLGVTNNKTLSINQ